MGIKKKRSSRKSHLSGTKAYVLVCSFFLGCLIALGLFIYLSNSIITTSPPIYEEIYSITSDLNKKIGQIDCAIYESLYKRGITEKDIFFSAVRPMQERGYDWDFTELLINLPDKKSVIQLEKIINLELSKLKSAVRLKNEKIANSEIVYHVFALGLYTHKIRLIRKGYVQKTHKGLPRIAIIIDDLGYDRDMAISFMQLDLPLSLSVLPLAPYTGYIANEANKRGRELLLHLPMEPKGYPRLNPGPGALLVDMGAEEIREIIGDLVTQIPGIRGVNHHMGSYFTERVDKMSLVLSELKKRNLFYIDSRTTSKTVAFKQAKKMGVPVAKKSVFLDHDLSSKAIKFQLERLLGMARYSGTAVGIGHPHKETLKILKEYLDLLKTEYNVVPVSELVS